MADGPTLAVTLDFDAIQDDEETNDQQSEGVWGRLISLNPSYPNVDLQGKTPFLYAF
jgi:hypothetical protein